MLKQFLLSVSLFIPIAGCGAPSVSPTSPAFEEKAPPPPPPQNGPKYKFGFGPIPADAKGIIALAEGEFEHDTD